MNHNRFNRCSICSVSTACPLWCWTIGPSPVPNWCSNDQVQLLGTTKNGFWKNSLHIILWHHPTILEIFRSIQAASLIWSAMLRDSWRKLPGAASLHGSTCFNMVQHRSRVTFRTTSHQVWRAPRSIAQLGPRAWVEWPTFKSQLQSQRSEETEETERLKWLKDT